MHHQNYAATGDVVKLFIKLMSNNVIKAATFFRSYMLLGTVIK